LIAPPASVSRSSGITRAQSIPMVRPKPRHDSHAPIGLLKEKVPGVDGL
jgi:hypothetical protein